MRNILCCMLRATIIAFTISAVSASATTFSTNYSDLWWNPNESGWGANVTQQADVMFVTLFIYNQNNVATWYSATLRFQSEDVVGNKTFTGDLYQTFGPFFGTTFDPTLVALRKVGVATFASKAVTTAILQYSVDGAVVTKDIQRQTLAVENLAGAYLGATSDVTFGCTNPARNGLRTNDVGAIAITQTGTSIAIKAPTCTFTGKYSQQGQTGNVDGTYTCTNGAAGTIKFFDLRAEVSGIIGRYAGADESCGFSGNIGALRQP